MGIPSKAGMPTRAAFIFRPKKRREGPVERLLIGLRDFAIEKVVSHVGSTPKTGQAPSTGSFSDRFMINSPAISAAQNAHTQAIIFEVARLYTKGLTTRPTYSTFPSATICKNQSDDGQCARTKPPPILLLFPHLLEMSCKPSAWQLLIHGAQPQAI